MRGYHIYWYWANNFSSITIQSKTKNERLDDQVQITEIAETTYSIHEIWFDLSRRVEKRSNTVQFHWNSSTREDL